MKKQGHCGSCVAFATVANVETCFKKVTGVFGDYSEQQMLDCAYEYKKKRAKKQKYETLACRGSAFHSYTDWLADKEVQPASEEEYPYTASKGECPKPMPSFDQVKLIIIVC